MKKAIVCMALTVSLPVRFGNNLPASVGANLQIGFTFN
jgi:hypothetical protein